jgi:hypothetical protein
MCFDRLVKHCYIVAIFLTFFYHHQAIFIYIKYIVGAMALITVGAVQTGAALRVNTQINPFPSPKSVLFHSPYIPLS